LKSPVTAEDRKWATHILQQVDASLSHWVWVKCWGKPAADPRCFWMGSVELPYFIQRKMSREARILVIGESGEVLFRAWVRTRFEREVLDV